MHARFHVPAALHSGDILALPADEAVHATRVLRLQTGDAVRVFDGRGHEFLAVIVHGSKDRVEVRLGDTMAPAPERRVAVTLAQAVLKGDKMDDVVRDAVMMGVTSIVPLVTARTEVSATLLRRGRRRERWQRIAVVAAKQCGRAVVPPIEEPRTLHDFCTDAADRFGERLMFVEPAASASATNHDLPAAPCSSVAVIVGPEGGWSAEELAATAPLVSRVTLRGPTLRADAMPLVALTALFVKCGDL